MKLLERRIDFENDLGIYGVDTFDDGAVVPWYKPKDLMFESFRYDNTSKRWKTTTERS